ncbi:DNA-directed RNA polymerase subunit beta [Chryseomicrobium sp. FSL W7-1435]|uniref:DNA-directed RNA polymerase subunit beta n=1 Tax=Chryseomicrobium sp. FSL W7-1435 TaxID=2921704 RepID=UPI00315B380F
MDEEKVVTRKQVKAVREKTTEGQEKMTEQKPQKPTRWVQIRLIPIWLRVILVLLLIAGAIAGGLTVGYAILGGGEATDALKWETYQHILDIMNGTNE